MAATSVFEFHTLSLIVHLRCGAIYETSVCYNLREFLIGSQKINKGILLNIFIVNTPQILQK